MYDREIRKRLSRSLGIILFVFFFGVLGHYFLIDGITLVEAVYVTVVTIGTVGYGDISTHLAIPKESWRHEAGELFSCLLIILGISAFIYAIGVVTEYVVSGEIQREGRRRKMQRRIARLRGHFVVCGGGETGLHILRELVRTRRPFVLVEQSEERLKELEGEFPQLLFVEGDATLEAHLRLAGLEQAAGLVAALPDEKDNLVLALTAGQQRERLGPGFRIAAKVTDAEGAGPKLRLAGADAIVAPSAISGRRLVAEMFRPAVTTFLDRMLRDTRAVMRVEEATIQPQSPLHGLTLAQAQLPQKVGLVVAALSRQGHLVCNPDADRRLEAGDVLIAIGDMDHIARLRELAQRRS
jgi:voltage-gated potassium channel